MLEYPVAFRWSRGSHQPKKGVPQHWTSQPLLCKTFFSDQCSRKSLSSPPFCPGCRRSWVAPSACSTTGSGGRDTSSGHTPQPAWASASRSVRQSAIIFSLKSASKSVSQQLFSHYNQLPGQSVSNYFPIKISFQVSQSVSQQFFSH